MSKLRSVKGMNDVLPEDAARWHRLESTFRELVGRYGFGEVRTPLVEPTDLFVRSIGEATDIVEKEMYTFEDKGEKSLTLRPEGTASAARAWIQHSVGGKHPVSKWFYLGPMYRRERPAKGRYRQFWQAGCEIYGDPGPYVDAELIDFVVRYLRALGIQHRPDSHRQGSHHAHEDHRRFRLCGHLALAFGSLKSGHLASFGSAGSLESAGSAWSPKPVSPKVSWMPTSGSAPNPRSCSTALVCRT